MHSHVSHRTEEMQRQLLRTCKQCRVREVEMGLGMLQEVFLLRRQKQRVENSRRRYSRDGRKGVFSHELFSQVQPCICAY